MGDKEIKPGKVLIVEDDEDLSLLCKIELEEEGYKVLTARNAADGTTLFADEKPDLVILDIKLPDKDGLQLLDELKLLRPEIPVIMHTSFDFMYDFAAGASDAYVVKSSDMTDLKKTIRKLLNEGPSAGEVDT